MANHTLKYKTILFDLDGTLIESGPGIFGAVNAMLVDSGKKPRADKDLYPLIGPPIRTGFREILGLPEENVDQQVNCYREHYQREFHRLIHPFAGIIGMLETLKAAGARIGVVTSKMEPIARQHIMDMGLDHCVEYLCGANTDGRGDKPALLRKAIADLSLEGEDLRSTVMVGDRLFDLNGANAVGLDSIGVLYGYGAREELEACKPRYLVNTVEELTSLLLGE